MKALCECTVGAGGGIPTNTPIPETHSLFARITFLIMHYITLGITKKLGWLMVDELLAQNIVTLISCLSTLLSLCNWNAISIATINWATKIRNSLIVIANILSNFIEAQTGNTNTYIDLFSSYTEFRPDIHRTLWRQSQIRFSVFLWTSNRM